MSNDIRALAERVRRFSAEREWEPFHTPKNLATALAVEAAELLEQFQWLTAEQSSSLSEQQLQAARLEMGDVFLYLLQLADKLSVDLCAAAREKLELNEAKYPVTKARGVSTKYTDL